MALLVTAGCGSDDSGSADRVDIKDFKYGPATIEVAKGTKVSFTNEDTAKHTATSKPEGTFDSGDITRGQTKAVTFEKAGTFDYSCVYHPTMAGKVTVTD